MLAKMTSKNQITLPKAVISKLPPSEYYEVEAVNDCIMLTPVRVQNGRFAVWHRRLLGPDLGHTFTQPGAGFC